MRGIFIFIANAAFFLAGLYGLGWYSVAIIATAYAVILTITHKNRGPYWGQAFLFWLVGGFIFGFIPYYIGIFIGSL